ncbi:MAG: aminoacyl-tRNA hydrolase [Oscillospiraceae bacterium]|jgi:PTH1 family peptidyl-tRNA hydrolase|nr:aminoacyl-tRNA hydrolase [Oscillospiraceae bacterium]
MFFRKAAGAPAWVIAGLGNPGKQYEVTRHNAGFLCLDLLSVRERVRLTRLKFNALTGEVMLGGERCLLLKPQTFMNNSGEAVGEAAAFYKIPPERVLVLFDDVSLEPGNLRIRRKGSAGSHNGVKSVIQHLCSESFPRVKLGVGERPNPQWDLADWVLSRMTDKEQLLLREACSNALCAADLIVRGRIEEAMGKYSR